MGRKKSTFTLTVLAEDGVLYYGEATRLFVPYQKSYIAVLLHHTPVIMKLSSGIVKYVLDGKETSVCTIKSGLLRVQEDEVVVIANGAANKPGQAKSTP